MALFWLLVGVLSTLAVLILLLPWLRAIPRLGPLPAVSWPALVGAAAMLAAAVGLYATFGRPELAARTSTAPLIKTPMPSAATAAGAAGSAPMSNGGGSMNTAIASLEARLAKGGGTKDDWELLAKSYEFVGRPADAAKARAQQLPPPEAAAAASEMPQGVAGAPVATPPALSARSLKRLTEAGAARREKKYAVAAAIYRDLSAGGQMNADSWADYADTAATLQGNKLAGEPETYIARALALNPQHTKALWLKASADEEGGRYSDAIVVWQQLAATLDPRSADAKIIAANLQQDIKLADATAGTSGGTAGAANAGAANAGAANAGASNASGVEVSGEVTLAEALRARASNPAVLYIVAKSVDSPGMPVAVLRASATSWPVKFTLDDSRAMMPGRNLSNAGRVRIEARVSNTGQATPSSGDLQGSSDIINPSAHPTPRILIDRVIQ